MHALFAPEKGEPGEVFAKWQEGWKSLQKIRLRLFKTFSFLYLSAWDLLYIPF